MTANEIALVLGGSATLIGASTPFLKFLVAERAKKAKEVRDAAAGIRSAETVSSGLYMEHIAMLRTEALESLKEARAAREETRAEQKENKTLRNDMEDLRRDCEEREVSLRDEFLRKEEALRKEFMGKINELLAQLEEERRLRKLEVDEERRLRHEAERRAQGAG